MTAISEEPVRAGPDRPRRATFAVLLFAVVLLGLGVRLTALAIAPDCRIGSNDDVLAVGSEPAEGCVIINDTTNYVATAEANATGHWFQQPRDDGTGYEPAGLHPPLYALFLSVPFRLGIDDVDGLRVVTTLLGGVTVALAGLVGRRLGGDRVGLLGAGLVALHPMVWINDVVLMSEALYAPFVLGAILAAYHWWDHPSTKAAAGIGVALGAAALVRSEAILGVLMIGLPLCLGRRTLDRRGALTALGALVGVALLTVMPWVAYNQARFHRPVAFTTSLGVAERLANCDATYFGRERFGSRSPACLLELADPGRPNSVVLPADPDQSDFDEALRDEATTYVKANLGRAPVVGLARLGRMWGVYRPFETIRLDEPVEQRGIGRSQLGVVMGWLVAAAAVSGAVTLFRRRVPLSPLLAWVGLACVVGVTNLGLHRFRSASEIALCLLAAVAVDRYLTRRRHLATP